MRTVWRALSVWFPKHLLARPKVYSQSRAFYFTYPGSVRLKDVVKLPLLERRSRQDIVNIWEQRYATDPHRCGGFLSKAQHETLSANSRNAPHFVLPVPRGPGAFEVVMSQFQGKFCLVTGLEEYKRNSGSPNPFMVLTFFDELAAEKDLVLVKGDILLPRALSGAEGAHILKVLIECYACPNQFRWVRLFNESPRDFKFDEFQRDNSSYFAYPLLK